MSSTQTITFKDVEIRWARVFEQNRDKMSFNEETGKYDQECPLGGKYMVDVFLNDDQMKELRKSGSKAANNIKEDESGREYVNFKRPHQKFNRDGELLDWASGAPEVTDEFGEEWSYEGKGPIGNDSVADVTVVVYGKKPMIGTRLEAIKVSKAMDLPDMEEKSETGGGFV